MLIIVTVSLLTGFTLGCIYKEILHHIKRRNRYERRNRIIKKQMDIVDEISRWEIEHPELLMITAHKGTTIFKGGANLMSPSEFKEALRSGRRKKSTLYYGRR